MMTINGAVTFWRLSQNTSSSSVVDAKARQERPFPENFLERQCVLALKRRNVTAP